MNSNLPNSTAATRRRLLPSLLRTATLSACLAPVLMVMAAAPPNAAVEMTFSEGSGTSAANTGFLAGTANLDAGTTTNGFPNFTNTVPAGTFAPAGNASALAFGGVDTTGGGRKVDLTTVNGPLGTVGSFIGGMTICGWLNSQDNRVGSGGNRIAFALETPNGLGFDLMQQPAGALGFNVNHYTGAGPLSSVQMVTENAGADASNWVFFAVTYHPTQPTEQVRFYFGRADKLAGFDVARTYFGGPTNEIEFTGPLTIGNFSAVEPAYSATGTGSRTYRGLIDQLRIYTNVLSIEEIQQAQLESSTVPAIAATILRQPQDVSVVAAPFKTATFTVDAHGSGLVTYQWRTNGVTVPGATNASLALLADSSALNGTLVSVLVDNSLTTDPGVVSSNALLTITEPVAPDAVIPTSADVLYNGTAVLNAWSQSQQINWGLGGSGGVATSAGRRSFMVFTLGAQPVAAAKLKVWNYWGGPPVNGQGRLAEANTRIYGTLTNAPLVISEPPPGSNTTIPGFDPPNNTNFIAIAPDKIVGPAIGWYEWDITGWYNACLGQTTTIMLRASATSGFDFPLYEDRESTAFTAGAGGTLANTGPRIEIFLPETSPRFDSVNVVGGQVVLAGSGGPANGEFHLLTSTNINLPSPSWTSIATNHFDAGGSFILTNSLASGSEQSYFQLRLP